MTGVLRCLLISIICAAAVSSALPRIRVDDQGRFRDPAGRQRMFRGFNSVEKQFPWYDNRLLNATRLAAFKRWGLNAGRIGCMWSGVAPARGVFNESYLQTNMKIVRMMEAQGIYALLDMHQDVISSRYGSYDGAPLWVINSLPNDSAREYPFPFTAKMIKDNWNLGYLTMAVANAFQHMYRNSSGVWNHWGDFWAKVAQTFKSQQSVIGYELINEPFAGDFYTGWTRILPGVAGSENLLPTYDYLVSRIRAIDNDTLVFYEPVTWGMFLHNNGVLGSGFSRVPGGPTQKNKSVFSVHYYCLGLPLSEGPDPLPEWKRDWCDRFLMPTVLRSVAQDIAVTGGGVFLTEFGECEPDGNPRSGNTIVCNDTLIALDQQLISWTYEDDALFKPDGHPNYDIIRFFARPYPQATAGTVLSLSFKIETAVMDLAFLLDPEINALTEVYVPVDLHYQHGFRVTITPNLLYTFNVDDRILKIDGRKRTKSIVRVHIEPRSQ